MPEYGCAVAANPFVCGKCLNLVDSSQHVYSCKVIEDKRARDTENMTVRVRELEAEVQRQRWRPTIESCDEYLDARTGKYEWRARRYRSAIQIMRGPAARARGHQLQDSHTIVDVGAGWTELDYCLRAEYGWRGRYVPVDGGVDGTDLNDWVPPRRAEFFVALEIIEHLDHPVRLLDVMKDAATGGVVVSTPNPRTTDVLGMDPTHVSAVPDGVLRAAGFTVEERSFYGQPNDSLFAWWLR